MTDANYAFSVRVRPRIGRPDLRLSPAEFELQLSKTASQPGDDGWLFFRDYLWRGNLNDEEYFRRELESALDMRVTSVSFSGLRTSPEYLEALKSEIRAHLDLFNAETVEEVLNKYLGSSIQVE
ncbi:LWR-salt protein [Haladaptatus sp. GCM10025707]|uniref:LWR-salt protein n=1 Tax=unclassified Haladaptatus TaxID=2622732 RepID=UPI0023E8F6A2|nr:MULTISPECIES: LWR-salt protein [unclassified Haladaptatus]